MTASEGLPLLQDQDPTSPHAKAQLRASQTRQTRRRVGVGAVVATLLVLTALLLSRNNAAPWQQQDIADDYDDPSPYAAVVAAYRASVAFDGVVQVRVDGSVVFELASGCADEELDVPMALDSIFPVGSNSKLFVAVALYQLQERGLVNLSHPVNQYLNQDDFASFGFPNQTAWCPHVGGAPPDSPCENVTFVQLLHMGSGIGDSLNCDNVDAAHCHASADNLAYYKGSLAAYVGVFINDPLVFKPGSNYSYSNPNYYLLSYMVEKISGEPLEKYVQLMIADKIGLRDTFYDPYSGGLGVRHGYVQQYVNYYAQPSLDVKPEFLATGTCSPYLNSGAVSGSGGFRSTSSDMQRWYLDLFDNRGTTSKVLRAESVRMIIERRNPFMPAYAQGVSVGDLRADGWPKALAYCGGMKCCTTCLAMLVPENTTDASVVVSAFSSHSHVMFADRAAFERFRPKEFLVVPENITGGDAGGAVVLRPALIQAYFANAEEVAVSHTG